MMSNYYEMERQMHEDVQQRQAGTAREERAQQVRRQESREEDRLPWRVRRRMRIWAGR